MIRNRLVAALLLLTHMLSARPCWNETFWSSPRNITPTPDMYGTYATLATDGKGTYLVLFELSILMRSENDGLTWTAPYHAAYNGTYLLGEGAKLATDGKGRWIMAYTGNSLDGGSKAVKVSRSSDSGKTWGAVTQIAPAPVNSGVWNGGTQIATDTNGAWVVVWQSNLLPGGSSPGTDHDILFSRSTDNGATWSPHLRLNSNAGTDSADDLHPVLATDRAGTWGVVWHVEDDVYFSRSTDNGATWSSMTRINKPPCPNIVKVGVAASGSGTWVSVWNTGYYVFGSRSADNGSTWTVQAPICRSPVSIGKYASVQTDGRGNWLSAWLSRDNLDGTLGTLDNVLYSRSSDDGSTWTAPQHVATDHATKDSNDGVYGMQTDGKGLWMMAFMRMHHDNVDVAITTATLAADYHVVQDDQFTTNCSATPGSRVGWSTFGMTTGSQMGYPGGLVGYDWDSANTALRGRVYSSTTSTAADYRYRVAGWISNQAEWMPYTYLGTQNYARVKYYMYASGMSNPNDSNQIPCFRIRASNRFAVTSNFECFHHDITDPGNLNYARELRPSTDATKPSLYRVDFDPVDVPYLQLNATSEGVLRAFEAFSFEPQDNGFIAMAESVMGWYPASLLDNAAGQTLQIYQTSTTDAGDLKVFSPNELQIGNYVFPANLKEGQLPAWSTTPPTGQHWESNAGVTLDTSSLSTNTLGLVVRNFNPDRNTDNYSMHPRVEAGKQYKIRFHVTSTQMSNINAPLCLRARSIKFAWSQKLELGGPYAAGPQNNAIAQQVLPGIGCQNPDRNASENGGWYTLLMHTPMSVDIRTEYPAGTPIAASMPYISSEANPGVGRASRRDIRVGADLIDTLDTMSGAAKEKGNCTIDRIEIRGYDLVPD